MDGKPQASPRCPARGIRVAAERRRRIAVRAAECLTVSALAVLLQPRPAFAQAAAGSLPAQTETVLPPVEVIAATPLLGSGVDRDKVPAEARVLTDRDITRDGYADALRALNELVPGVTLGSASGNPFQPTLLYHGFQASPLQGTPQGLAVYVNGARFNQPFGDTVDWDLIPDLAIDRLNVVGSNPVFGLNALGGAVAVQMKNGFTYHGAEIDLLGGSFAKYQGQFQYGVESGNVAGYVAANGLQEGGWRDVQSSQLRNFFGDLGWRGERGEFHIDVTAANNRLNQPGTTPIQQLAVDPAGVFTAPNLVANHYVHVNLTGNSDISDQTSLQGNLYYGYFQQKVYNGDVSEFETCDNNPGFLCAPPEVFVTNRAGNPIPDFLNGGPYLNLDQQSTNTNGYGAAIQATNRTPLFDRPNQFVVGLSFDGGQTLFGASTQVGGLSVATSMFAGPGIVVDQADGSIAPVRIDVSNAYYGAFFTDTYDLTPSLSANVSGRFNFAQINLKDEEGGRLTGDHRFSRFNPAGGLTWKVRPDLALYASYAEANRAPIPAELSCADAASPCSLANFFVGDPDLKQVVAHTVEAGVRGHFAPFPGAILSSDLAYYHTTLDDDIQAVNSDIQGRAFFRNVGSTLRQGADLRVQLKTDRLLAWAAYSYIEAAFLTGFTASSENNPEADANGNIQVRPGDRLPGIPSNLFKLGIEYRATDKWTIGGTGIAAGGQFLFGDEANLLAKTPSYFIFNLHTSYQVAKNLQLFGLLENVFNKTYYTFGTLAPISEVPIARVPNANNPRAFSPGAPIAVTAGVRLTF